MSNSHFLFATLRFCRTCLPCELFRSGRLCSLGRPSTADGSGMETQASNLETTGNFVEQQNYHPLAATTIR